MLIDFSIIDLFTVTWPSINQLVQNHIIYVNLLHFDMHNNIIMIHIRRYCIKLHHSRTLIMALHLFMLLVAAWWTRNTCSIINKVKISLSTYSWICQDLPYNYSHIATHEFILFTAIIIILWFYSLHYIGT